MPWPSMNATGRPGCPSPRITPTNRGVRSAVSDAASSATPSPSSGEGPAGARRGGSTSSWRRPGRTKHGALTVHRPVTAPTHGPPGPSPPRSRGPGTHRGPGRCVRLRHRGRGRSPPPPPSHRAHGPCPPPAVQSATPRCRPIARATSAIAHRGSNRPGRRTPDTRPRGGSPGILADWTTAHRPLPPPGWPPTR